MVPSASTRVPQRSVEAGQIVEHLVYQPADRPRDVLATVPTVAAQLPVEEQRQQVVRREEQPVERLDALMVMGEDVGKMPPAGPLMKAGVLDVPPAPRHSEHL